MIVSPLHALVPEHRYGGGVVAVTAPVVTARGVVVGVAVVAVAVVTAVVAAALLQEVKLPLIPVFCPLIS